MQISRQSRTKKKKIKRSKHDKTVTKETTEKLWTREERRVVLNHYSFYLPSWTDSFSPSILFPWKVTTGVSARITLLDTRDRNERQRERKRGAIRKGRKSFIGEKKKKEGHVRGTWLPPRRIQSAIVALLSPLQKPFPPHRDHDRRSSWSSANSKSPPPLSVCKVSCYVTSSRAAREREREVKTRSERSPLRPIGTRWTRPKA